MKVLSAVIQSKGVAYAALAAGWLILGFSERLPESWRTPAMLLGGALFAWSWLKVSPCAQGNCHIPPK